MPRPLPPRICVAAATLGALALLLPAGAAAWDPPADAVVAELPFLQRDGAPPGRIYVDLAPQDSARRMPMQLDTGASAAVMTPRMARSLGVHVRRLKNTPYRKATILGRDLQFWVDVRYSDTGARTMEYGLLGGEFLSSFVLDLDWQARRVRFLDARKGRVPRSVAEAGEQVLPLAVVSNRPHVEIELNGHRVRALLDTGSDPPLMIRQRDAERYGVALRSVGDLHVTGVIADMHARLGRANVVLGNVRIDDVPVVAVATGFNQFDSTGVTLGQPVLARFAARIDYRSRRLWLRSVADPPAFPLQAESAPPSEPTAEPAPHATP